MGVGASFLSVDGCIVFSPLRRWRKACWGVIIWDHTHTTRPYPCGQGERRNSAIKMRKRDQGFFWFDPICLKW